MDLATRSDYIEVPMNEFESDVLNKANIKLSSSRTSELEEAILIENKSPQR